MPYHILEIAVQRLHHVVDELKHSQLVFLLVVVGAHDEEQRGVAAVDDFVIAVLEERALFGGDV